MELEKIIMFTTILGVDLNRNKIGVKCMGIGIGIGNTIELSTTFGGVKSRRPKVKDKTKIKEHKTFKTVASKIPKN